jgi:hypothetical protein
MRVTLVVAIVGLFVFPTACGGPTSVVAIAGAGDLTSKVLDDMQDQASVLISQAAGAASLVSTKAARDAELLIQVARQDMLEQQNVAWDHLDDQKRSVLVEIYKSLQSIDKDVAKAGDLKDGFVLDISAVMDRLHLGKNIPRIQKVAGASQFYLDGGSYRLDILTNIVDNNSSPLQVSIGDRKLKNDEKLLAPQQIITGQVAHQLSINLHSDDLENRFNKFDLATVPINISTKFSDQPSWYEFWKKPKFRDVDMSFTLELFPKFPVEYSLIEKDLEDAVDTEHPKTQIGQVAVVPGCGHDGCNAWQQVCTNLLEPGIPIRVSAYFDSFNGAWGNFEPSKNVTNSNGICSVFYQHSHNVPRNVSFNVDYYPMKQEPTPHYATLQPATLGKVDPDLEVAIIPTNGPCAGSEQHVQSGATSATASFNFGFFSGAASLSAIESSAVEAIAHLHSDMQTVNEKQCSSALPLKHQSIGWIRFGRAYTVQFKRSMSSYIFVARFFDRHEEVWPSKNAPLLDVLDVRTSNDKSATIQIKKPW